MLNKSQIGRCLQSFASDRLPSSEDTNIRETPQPNRPPPRSIKEASHQLYIRWLMPCPSLFSRSAIYLIQTDGSFPSANFRLYKTNTKTNSFPRSLSRNTQAKSLPQLSINIIKCIVMSSYWEVLPSISLSGINFFLHCRRKTQTGCWACVTGRSQKIVNYHKADENKGEGKCAIVTPPLVYKVPQCTVQPWPEKLPWRCHNTRHLTFVSALFCK